MMVLRRFWRMLLLSHADLATDPACWDALDSESRCCVARDPTCFSRNPWGSFQECCESGGTDLDPASRPPAAAHHHRSECNIGDHQMHYIRRDYVHRSAAKVLHQADMDGYSIHTYYLLERYLALRNHSGACIIDVGCGVGYWASNILRNSGCVICIDLASHLRKARLNVRLALNDSWVYDRERWPPPFYTVKLDLEANLSTTDLGARLVDLLPGSIVVCSEVVEHLVDPTRGLLPLLKDMLLHGAIMVLLATPSRDAWYDHRYHHGPPKNLFHVREWNRQEFDTFLRCNEMPVAIVSEVQSTLFAVLTRLHLQSPKSLLSGSAEALNFARGFINTASGILLKRRQLDYRRWKISASGVA